jgi:Cu+-exporting ATPase
MATPMSLTTGVGKGAENGILIRSGDALQIASRLDTVVLDKTGTITWGKPVVTDIVDAQGDDDNLLALIAAVEQASEHPLAGAIVAAAREHGLNVPAVQEFNAVPGHGVRARVDGHQLLLGNQRLMDIEGIDVASIAPAAERLAEEGKTPMFAAVDGEARGLIAVADTIKDDSVAAIARL